MTTHRLTIITYREAYRDVRWDLCDRHAASQPDADAQRDRAGIGVLGPVEHGQHAGTCAACAWRTTPETVTDAQIRTLYRAADGDTEMAAIAERALDELHLTARDDDPCGAYGRYPDHAAVDRALAMTVREARAECARVIADAEAQSA